jgi:endo-1,4-beta-xylanase
MISLSLRSFLIAVVALLAAFIAILAAPHVGCMAQVNSNSSPTNKPVPPGGTPLLPEDAFAQLKANNSPSLKIEPVNVEGQSFTKALRISTLQRPQEVYGLQLSGPSLEGVKKGDVLLMTCYVRTIKGQAETGESRTQFVFERNEAPHTKAVSADISIPASDKGWKRIDVPFIAGETLTPDKTHVSFRLGYDPQTFELGGVRLVNYGTTVAMKDLPRTQSTYAGQDANAPWRKEAEARIEKIRKGDLAITVKDASGKLVKDATVSVRMQRHAFAYGSAIAADGLLKDDPDSKKYQELIPKLFNRVVMENDLKWSQYEQNPERAKKGVAWLRERNIEVRGHNLVWPSAKFLPKDLPGLLKDKAALAKRIDDHIVSETQAFSGQLVQWDVINEPYANHELMDVLGNEAMVHWFKLTREHDKKAVLFLNDYPPMDGSDKNSPHLNHFYKTIGYLKDNDAPIGGIGFQGHFGGAVIPPARVLSCLDRFQTFGLPIAVTEFDIDTSDEQMQADYTRDFLTALFSHPSVDSILIWGFWEGRHWKPEAAMYRKDWSIKPNGQVWQDLWYKQWWTNADGKTNAQGVYKTRGFLGDYSVTVTSGGKTQTVPVKLTKAGTLVSIQLK